MLGLRVCTFGIYAPIVRWSVLCSTNRQDRRSFLKLHMLTFRLLG